MITFALQSGSHGNSIYVEVAGARLLIDAGISGRQVEQRLAHHGVQVRDIDAILITHDHVDHLRGAGICQRRYGIPLYMTPNTLRAARHHLKGVHDVRHFEAGESLHIEGVRIETYPTPHDAVDGVVFVIEAEGRRLGVFTDLGHPFDGLRDLLQGVDAAYLESNYDPEMLEIGPYPFHTKERIRGAGGHLSNLEAAEVILASGARRPKWVALAHLSEKNNHPRLAHDTHRRIVGESADLRVVGREGVSDLFRV